MYTHTHTHTRDDHSTPVQARGNKVLYMVCAHVDPNGVTMYVCGEMPTVLNTTEMRNGYPLRFY